MFEQLAVAVGGQLLSGMMGSDAAEDASSAQSAATDRAIASQERAQAEATAELRRQYNLTRKDLAPYRDAGTTSLSALMRLMGFSPSTGQPTGQPGGTQAPAQNLRTGTLRGNQAFQPDGSYMGRYGIDPGAMTLDDAASTWTSAVDRLVDEGGNEVWINPRLEAAQSAQTQYAPVEAQEITDSPLNRRFTVSDFYDDPVTKLSMEYGLNEGRKAIDLGAGAAGLRNSGATLKALTKFGTDYAGGQAAGSEGRFKDWQSRIFSNLSGVAGVGQNATNATASAGAGMASGIANTLTGTAGRIGDLYSSMGNARGAASIAGGNAWGNAFGTIGNWWTDRKLAPETKSANLRPSSLGLSTWDN